jgi:hypothetical protein
MIESVRTELNASTAASSNSNSSCGVCWKPIEIDRRDVDVGDVGDVRDLYSVSSQNLSEDESIRFVNNSWSKAAHQTFHSHESTNRAIEVSLLKQIIDIVRRNLSNLV